MLRPYCLVILLLFVATLAGAAPPNILWLSCEDLSPRLGCYGDSVAPTPRIDQLAQQSILYTHAFSATGVCSPSRHTLITGLYPMQSGAQYHRATSKSAALKEIVDPQLRALAEQRPLYQAVPPEGVRCFPEYLRAAGYYCTNNVKQDYQFNCPVTVWDESSRKAHWRNRAPGQPFFAVFNSTVTHESGVHGKQPRSPRYTDPAKVPVPRFLPDTPGVRDDLARHYDNVIALDQWVGDRLDELDQAGIADETIVLFFSDHGDGLPRHKRWVYDSGTRVPLLVRFPDGDRAGEVDDTLVSFPDLPPTTLALAGIERPDYMPGRVFVGPDAEPEPRCVFMHRDRMDDTSHETIRAARDKRFRYVRNYRPEKPYLQHLPYRDRAASMQDILRLHDAGELGPDQWQWTATQKPREELYDTVNDPDEVENLAGKPEYAAKLAELSAELDAWVERIDDPLATDEVEVIQTRVWPPQGEQPTTAAPQATIDSDSRQVTLTCATPSASLGYRLAGEKTWRLYTDPFTYEGAPPTEFVAHRIGWKPNFLKAPK